MSPGGPDAPRPRKGGTNPGASGKSMGMFLAGILLAAILGVAALSKDAMQNRGVERNYYKVRALLLDDRLDPETLELAHDTRTLRANVKDPGEGPTEVALEFATDDEMTRFRQDVLDRYNSEHPGANLDWKVTQYNSAFWSALLATLPWLALIVLAYFFLVRQVRAPGAGGGVLGFGRTRARATRSPSTGVTFADVAGISSAKAEVLEVIEFLRDPRRFQKLGGRMPRGIILVGSPGTGKTLLAKAIAGEAEVPFYSICGSDFVEMFVGVGAARVRDLFRQARENSPCILFVDEVDAVGRRRGSSLGGGHDEREQTLNAILVEMDGFKSDDGIVFIAATNRPDVLDPALLRPGRFDREIVIDLPDLKGREEILRVHSRKVRLSPSVDMRRIARGTPSFSGAELAALVNEGAILAALKNQDAVLEEDLEEARDKIRWGRQKAHREITDEDRRIIAFHEAGHALAARLMPDVEPLHKVTIIPRGMALGSTMQLPERDQLHLSRKKVVGTIMLLYAGRIAEEIFCGDVTAGASNDIERATELARSMVCEWGMSEALGPVRYLRDEEHPVLGREFSKPTEHSDAITLRIDEEIRRILDQSYAAMEKLLRKHKGAVERIAEALLVKETLYSDEVAALIEGVPLEEGSIEAPDATSGA